MTYQEFIDGIISERGRDKVDGIYMEQHHIIPRCMNGTNDKDNLVYLTLVEHLRAHILLFRENPDNSKLAKAAFMMSNIGDNTLNELMLLIDDEEEFIRCSQDIIKAKERARTAQRGSGNCMYGKTYGANPNAKSRICLDTGEIFASAKEAGKHVGVTACCIIDACNGKQYRAGGFMWMNYSEWELLPNEVKADIIQYRTKELHLKNAMKKKPPKSKKWTPERKAQWKQKCSGANNPMYHKHHTEEAKAKMSKAKKIMYVGENNPRFGIPHTEETKRKISESRMGADNPNAHKVYCVELNMVFDTIKQALEYVGITSGIVQCCSDKYPNRTTAGRHPVTHERLHWKYVD